MREYLRLLPLSFDTELAARIGEAVIKATKPVFGWYSLLKEVDISALAKPYREFGVEKEGNFLWSDEVLGFLESNYRTSMIGITILEIVRDDGQILYGHTRCTGSRQSGMAIVSASQILAEGFMDTEFVERAASQVLHEIGESCGLQEHREAFPELEGRLCPMASARHFIAQEGRSAQEYLQRTGIEYCPDCIERLFNS